MQKQTKVLLAIIAAVAILGVAVFYSGGDLQGKIMYGTEAKGKLQITVDATTPNEDIAVAGSVDKLVSVFKATASGDEGFRIKKLTVVNRYDKIKGDTDNNIKTVRLSYTDSVGATVFKDGVLVNGVATFSGLNIIVPKNNNAKINVSADFNTIAAGATPGEMVALSIGNFEASGLQSGSKISSHVKSGLEIVNWMHVYETKPTLALAATSPSGSRSTGSSDDAFIFTVSANAQERINLRAGITLDVSDGFDSAGANNAALGASTAAGTQVDGSSVSAALDNYLASDSVSMIATGADLSNYDRISFWFRYDGAAMPTFAALKTNVTASATADPNTGGVALSQSLCGADAASPVNTEWYYCDVSIAAQTAAGEDDFHLEIDDSTGLTFASDVIYLDKVMAYNDKIKVDIATDADLDTYANNATNAGGPVSVVLKEGSFTKATGYVTTTTNGASATSTGSVTFIPTTQIEVAKGTTKTFTLNLNSGDLINEDTGSDDPVTFSIALGSSLDGTVTSGGFWWNDTNIDLDKGGTTSAAELTASAIKWVGKVASATLTGNTVKY